MPLAPHFRQHQKKFFFFVGVCACGCVAGSGLLSVCLDCWGLSVHGFGSGRPVTGSWLKAAGQQVSQYHSHWGSSQPTLQSTHLATCPCGHLFCCGWCDSGCGGVVCVEGGAGACAVCVGCRSVACVVGCAGVCKVVSGGFSSGRVSCTSCSMLVCGLLCWIAGGLEGGCGGLGTCRNEPGGSSLLSCLLSVRS